MAISFYRRPIHQTVKKTLYTKLVMTLLWHFMQNSCLDSITFFYKAVVYIRGDPSYNLLDIIMLICCCCGLCYFVVYSSSVRLFSYRYFWIYFLFLDFNFNHGVQFLDLRTTPKQPFASVSKIINWSKLIHQTFCRNCVRSRLSSKFRNVCNWFAI